MPRNLIGEPDAHSDGMFAHAILNQPQMEKEKPLPKLGRPKSLTVRFSRASDTQKVLDLYNGKRKLQIDPKGFVQKRDEETLKKATAKGRIALAIDEGGHIRASAIATRHYDGDSGSQNVTEIGAVLCDVSGARLSNLVVGMLALKQHFDPHASGRVFAKVAQDNVASNKVFASSLAWDAVCPEKEAPHLYDVAYRKNNGAGKRDRTWYAFREVASDKTVGFIQSVLDSEALQTKDGATIHLNANESSLWSTLHFHEMLASLDAAA